ncbi:hypothetical protein MIMGU_mgv1a0116472mg, partial [Erythranthe guttata]
LTSGFLLNLPFFSLYQGIWIGMMIGVVTETVALSFMTWKTNWNEEVIN